MLCLAGYLHAWHSFNLRQRAVLTHGPALPGDPLTDPEIDSRGAVEFWHSHAIISDEARTDLLTCNFSGVGPLNGVPDWQAAPEVCGRPWQPVNAASSPAVPQNLYQLLTSTMPERAKAQAPLATCSRSFPTGPQAPASQQLHTQPTGSCVPKPCL